MYKPFLKIGALAGALSVMLGAFAAHGLKKYLAADALAIFETAVRYQFYHVFAIIITGILYASFPSQLMKWAGYLFMAGMILFCGSLYVLCYIKYNHLPMEWMGAITPFGGAGFIGGWTLLFLAVSRRQ